MIGMQYIQRVQFVALQVATYSPTCTLQAYDTESLRSLHALRSSTTSKLCVCKHWVCSCTEKKKNPWIAACPLNKQLSKFASAMGKYNLLSWQSLALKENLLVLDNWMALFSSPVVALCISYLLAMEGIKTINELSVFWMLGLACVQRCLVSLLWTLALSLTPWLLILLKH